MSIATRRWTWVIGALAAVVGTRYWIDSVQVRDQVEWMRAAGNQYAASFHFGYHVPLLATVVVPAVIGGVLAWRGCRWWSLLPIVVWVVVPVGIGGLGFDRWSPLVWWWTRGTAEPGVLSMRGLTDHVLALGLAGLPVAALIAGPFSQRRARTRVRWEMALVGALLFALYLWVDYGIHAGLTNSMYPWVAMVFVFGFQYGRPRPGLGVVLGVVAAVMVPYMASPLAGSVTLIVAGLIGSGVAALSPFFDGDRDRSVSLLVGLNVLNVFDAVLTVFLVSTDAVAEANPVIAVIGMPGKTVLVGVASYALHRLRPRVMPHLVASLALIIAYQLAGTVGTLLAAT
jgi:hypothetical protein